MMKNIALLAGALLAPLAAAAVSIAEINGDRFLSPYDGKTVQGVEGLVTAVGKNGFWIVSETRDDKAETSDGIYVFGSTSAKLVAVGDVVSLDATVKEYRSNANYLYLTQLSSPVNLNVRSKGNKVEPLVIGKDTGSPPTEDYSELDGDDVLSYPNGQFLVSKVNEKLNPTSYGLDFWESLVGEYVTIKGATAVNRANQFGDTWVYGDWKVTSKNGHGGLTMVPGDSNPETIIIGSPLDGSKNPSNTKMGDFIGDITGVVYQDFGFYRILPTTAIKIEKPASADYPAVPFISRGNCKGVSMALYNTENLNPNSEHLPAVVQQIVDKLQTPDLIFLQEIQDDSGATNDGTTSGEQTLAKLASSIKDATGITYQWTEVVPENNQDGGAPGGNIRVAYLYRPDRVELTDANLGQANDKNEVVAGPDGPSLKYNPGRIDPANEAWSASRKPLVAMWTPKARRCAIKPKPFFTINVHWSSKGGSSSTHGDPRTPLNGAIEQRLKQAEVTGDFIGEILKADPDAKVIAAGDFNEFTHVEPIRRFMSKSGLVELDEVVGMDEAERYTYVFDMQAQALDHMFISNALRKNAKYQHLHVNSWQTFDDMVSDHDPSVALLEMC